MLCCRKGEYQLRWERSFAYVLEEGYLRETLYICYIRQQYIYMMRNCSYKCRKRAYKKIYREDGILLGNTRNCAYRAKYAVVGGLYMVSGSIGIYGGSSF